MSGGVEDFERDGKPAKKYVATGDGKFLRAVKFDSNKVLVYQVPDEDSATEFDLNFDAENLAWVYCMTMKTSLGVKEKGKQ